MKKYLFIWSIATALCLSAQANAATNTDTPTCADLGYTLSTNQMRAMGSKFTCTPCPVDGTIWSCASLVAETTSGGDDNSGDEDDDTTIEDGTDGTRNLCSRYPYSFEEVNERFPTSEGYRHYRCPSRWSGSTEIGDANDRYEVTTLSCPTGFSTNYDSYCAEESFAVDCVEHKCRRVFSADYSGGYVGYMNLCDNKEVYTYSGLPMFWVEKECTTASTTGSLCYNSSFISQYSSNSTLNNRSSCVAKYGKTDTTGWRKYRCQKGMSAGKPCLSSAVVVGYPEHSELEPCKQLHNATPYTKDCNF